MTAIEKYNTRADKINSLVCVGLDPDFEKLPTRFRNMQHPQFEFNKWIIEQTHDFTATYKPNIAFYEALGAQGMRDLELTMEYLHANHSDIYLLCDAKRGDIGNTSRAYAQELFDYFGFDGATLHPYLGRDAVEPFLEYKEKNTIVLIRTSNPDAPEFQDLAVGPPREKGEEKKLWEIIAEHVVKDWNYNNNCMLMVGATYPVEMRRAREIAGDMTFLSPGSGAQGGLAPEAVKAGLNSQGKGLMLNASRSIIFANNPRKAATAFRDEINRYRKR